MFWVLLIIGAGIIAATILAVTARRVYLHGRGLLRELSQLSRLLSAQAGLLSASAGAVPVRQARQRHRLVDV